MHGATGTAKRHGAGLRLAAAGAFVFGGVSLVSVIAGSLPASALPTAVSLYVTTTGSGTTCSHVSPCGSIKAAINTAEGGADAGDDVTINVAAGTYVENDTINASSLNSLTIAGAGATATIVNGNHAGSVFTVSNSGAVTFSGLTVENGSAVNGGGVLNDAGGTLTITDSTFSNNTSTEDGGGIDNADYGGTGTLTITDSTFSGNTADSDGGAIDSGDDLGIGTVTVTGSTFSVNTADSDGGAIDNGDDKGAGTLTITDSTFSGNGSDEDGGAIDNGDDGGTGILTITASTFSANSAASDGGTIDSGDDGGKGPVHVGANIFAGGCEQPGGGSWTDAGYNLGTDSSCLNGGTGDVTDPTLALPGLAPNGGMTKTILPAPTSSPVGVIPTGTTLNGVQVCPRTDQRGVASVGKCTIGAVEVTSAAAASCGAGLTSHVLSATYATGTFTGVFCVNANGDGTYTQHSPGLPANQQTLTGTGHIRVNGKLTSIQAYMPAFRNLNLVGSTNGTTSSFGESGSGFSPLSGTFTLS